jgi:hypothetical protein
MRSMIELLSRNLSFTFAVLPAESADKELLLVYSRRFAPHAGVCFVDAPA